MLFTAEHLQLVVMTLQPGEEIVVTERGGDVRLFLDGDLQFSGLDEHRYHEALVHPALALHPADPR